MVSQIWLSTAAGEGTGKWTEVPVDIPVSKVQACTNKFSGVNKE